MHFFAGQILEQERDATQAFLQKTAFVFLFPNADVVNTPSALEKRSQIDVYRDSLKLVQELGCPTLVLTRDDGTDHVQRILSFLKQDVLGTA